MRPEEIVRQKFLDQMIGELSFPKGLISVEKDLASLAFLPLSQDPHRRIDILAFAPGKEGLIPLLLVECKAEQIKDSALNQVLGYNRSIKAPFVCLTNGVETRTFWWENKKLVSIPFLPSFNQLLESL